MSDRPDSRVVEPVRQTISIWYYLWQDRIITSENSIKTSKTSQSRSYNGWHKAQLTHNSYYDGEADRLCLRIIPYYVELGCSNEINQRINRAMFFCSVIRTDWMSGIEGCIGYRSHEPICSCLQFGVSEVKQVNSVRRKGFPL